MGIYICRERRARGRKNRNLKWENAVYERERARDGKRGEEKEEDSV